MEHSDGLTNAYNNPNGLFYDQNHRRLYVAGTRSLRDVSQWHLIGLGKTNESDIYKRMESFLREHPDVQHLIGHSYGGAAVLHWQKHIDPSIKTTTFGAPVVDLIPRNIFYKPQRYCGANDPVCALDFSAKKVYGNIITNPRGVFNPHAYNQNFSAI